MSSSRRRVRVEDPGKLGILALAISSSTLLLMTDNISEGGWSAVVLLVIGYLTGNGRLARQGKRGGQPTLGPARREDDQP